jgi:hypothetical protein
MRRFRKRAELLRVMFTVLLVEVAPDPVMRCAPLG